MDFYMTTPDMSSNIESVLRRRGLEPQRVGKITETLYPEDIWTQIMEKHGQIRYLEYFPGPKHISDYYLDLFGIPSFRKTVKRMLRDGRQPVALGELEQIAGASTKRYVEYLDRMLLVELTETTVRLTREISDLGRSLEHYVAQLCIKELRGSAEWGVLLENLPRSGGDYDVLAWLEPSLMYIECKTSPPNNIHDAQLREFLQRSVELAPDLAVLLIDTESDLTDFVNGKLNPIIREEIGVEDEHYLPIREHPHYPRVFYGFHRIYVINSKRLILSQLRRCLQHYYAHVKGVSRWEADEPPNFTRARLRDD